MTEAGQGRRKRRSRFFWAGTGVIVIAAVAVTLALTLPATHQQPSNVLVSDNCGIQNDEGLSEPTTIQLACGDGEDVAFGLTWTQWGTTTATGHGTVTEVSCVPSCAEGKDVAYQATVTLSNPVRAATGKEYFVRITLTFTGNRPPGVSSVQMFKACMDTPSAPYVPACPPSDRGAF